MFLLVKYPLVFLVWWELTTTPHQELPRVILNYIEIQLLELGEMQPTQL
jgi:hypothetical protein